MEERNTVGESDFRKGVEVVCNVDAARRCLRERLSHILDADGVEHVMRYPSAILDALTRWEEMLKEAHKSSTTPWLKRGVSAKGKI